MKLKKKTKQSCKSLVKIQLNFKTLNAIGQFSSACQFVTKLKPDNISVNR